VELFRDVKIDWLGRSGTFLGCFADIQRGWRAVVLFWHGLPLDVDFKGGTVVRVKFDHQPDADRISCCC